MNVLKLAQQGRLKSAANAVAFPSGSGWFTNWYGGHTKIDYADEVGRGDGNSIVAACLGWMVDAWAEAPPYLSTTTTDGGEKKDFLHPAIELLRRPNPHYDDRVLWQNTLADLKVNDGNAYWHVIFGGGGLPIELYWIPAEKVEPRWNQSDSTSFITHYEYDIDGQKKRLELWEVIHFREGSHPTNQRKGYPRFKSTLREVFTDNEASATVATVLKNRAIIPVAWSPDFSGLKDTNMRSPTREEADVLEAKMEAKSSGDNRGKMIMHTLPMKSHQLSFNLSDIASREIRRLPEERICAIFRIPPGVVKMGAGLDRNTMANATIEDRQAWRNCIIPNHGVIASVLDFKFLPMFGIETTKTVLRFDTAGVPALDPDMQAVAETWTPVWEADAITLDEFREKIDMPAAEGERGSLYYSQVRPGTDADALQLRTESRARARARREQAEAAGIEEDAEDDA